MTTEKAPTDWEGMFPDTEAGLEAACIELCRQRALLDVMGWPPISKMFRQFHLGRGIADLLITHADQSVTVIEVKRGGLSLRDYCTGIGQLSYQAIMAASYFHTNDVRRVLATPGPIAPDLVVACAGAHVDILPTMTMGQWYDLLREAHRVLHG